MGRACCGALLREGTQAGEDVPRVLPAATSAAALELWRGALRNAAADASADKRGPRAAPWSLWCLGNLG